MKIHPLASALAVLIVLALCPLVRADEAGRLSMFATPVASEDLDPQAFAQSIDGKQSPVNSDGQVKPVNVLWTRNSQPRHNGVPSFGEGRSLSPRHLRIGFNQPVLAGSIVTEGNCVVSVLRPEAEYPGDLSDNSQWIPAQTVVDAKVVSEADGYVFWTLPPGVSTRALRFTHIPRPTDTDYAGRLGGVYVLSGRFANLSPYAHALASANEHKAQTFLHTDGTLWNWWDNWDDALPPKPVAQVPAWIMLNWDSPVAVSGFSAIFPGFGACEIQSYTGPAERHPRESSDADWAPVKTFDHVRSNYPLALPVVWLDFGKTVTTRAIRVRMTAAVGEDHPHLQGKTENGRKVWIKEIMAMSPLLNRPLSDSIPKKPEAGNAELAHAPIPIRFKLESPGYVTLVVDDLEGHRVRNLISQTPFPAGEQVAWWDAMDDLGRDADAARHGLYHVPGTFVQPGEYKVRGLYYKAIDLLYEFPVYTAGNPAWNTADHTGNWLANHTPPSCALDIPADRSPNGKELVYLGSHVSEGTHGLAWVDLDGRKVGGEIWVGGTWTGAQALALDSGPSADRNTILFAGAICDEGVRITRITPKGDKPLLALPAKKADLAGQFGGLCARDNVVVCSLPTLNKLLFIDGGTGKILSEHAVPSPRGLAYDGNNRLLVLSGKQLLRFAIGSGAPAKLPDPEVLVSVGLEEPRQVALDPAGNIYVSDRGASHQVKVFSPEGKPVRTIGKPGVPGEGAYDPNHLNNPSGLTVDGRGFVWVAEEDFQPKRVSVWKPDGTLANAFYGPAEYGGGGTLDSEDKSRFYYAGMLFRLDWEKGTSKLESVYWRTRSGQDNNLPDGHAAAGPPQLPLYADGHQYFANCYNSNPTNGASVATLWINKDGIAKPVAAVGRANDWSLLKTDAFKKNWPSGLDPKGDYWKNQAFCVWSDLKGDGVPDPDEVRIVQASSGGVTVMPDLSVVVSRVDGKTTRFTPKFNPEGVPVYDIEAGQPLASQVQSPQSSGGDQALVHPDGWTVLTVVPKPFSQLSIAGVLDGQTRWTYPDPWPGLHPSHEAPPPSHPGEIIGTTRLLGGFITPRRSDAGPLWAVNGNMGDMYLFTADGLFVTQFLQDNRQGIPWAMPEAHRGMNLNNVTGHDENFWPSMTQTNDGEVYLVDGGRVSLIHVTGLDTIRRLPDSKVSVTLDDLKQAHLHFAQSEAVRQAQIGRKVLRVPTLLSPPPSDARLEAWPVNEWAPIDKRGVAANFNSNSRPYDVQASCAIQGDRLFIAYRTGEKSLLQNTGDVPQAPFETGGTLELMLGTNPDAPRDRPAPVKGDLRLVVTQVKGKTLALIYRPVVPGTDAKDRIGFSSPWRTIYMDAVEDVSDQVQLLAGTDGNFVVSIGLSTLHWKPQAGKRYQADLGVLRGDAGKTMQRTYWSNKATGITADVPSEAELTPSLWGEFEVE